MVRESSSVAQGLANCVIYHPESVAVCISLVHSTQYVWTYPSSKYIPTVTPFKPAKSTEKRPDPSEQAFHFTIQLVIGQFVVSVFEKNVSQSTNELVGVKDSGGCSNLKGKERSSAPLTSESTELHGFSSTVTVKDTTSEKT